MNYTQRSKLIDRLCATGLMLIGVEIFYAVVRSSYMEYNYNFSNVTRWVNISGALLLAIGVIVLIYSYLKKSGSKASYGLELIALSFTAIALPGTYLEFPFPYNKLNIVFPIAFLIYYIGKAIYIFYKAQKASKPVSKKSSKKKKR